MGNNRKSGLDQVPRVLKKPFWTDRFLWIGIGTAIFWILLFKWLFF